MTAQTAVRWIEWRGTGMPPFRCADHDDGTGLALTWHLVELRNSRDLVREGGAMHHCIQSYRDRCASGEYSAFSLRVQGHQGPLQPVVTIAVYVADRTITEYRGRYNLRPNQAASAPRKQDLSRDYLRLLDRSQAILKRWAEQERLALE